MEQLQRKIDYKRKEQLHCDLNGNKVQPDDPERAIWYSACCTFWTDDWNKVARLGVSISRAGMGIPCCPYCKSVGFQDTYANWMGGAKQYQEMGHPWYCKFLLEAKERCVENTNFESFYIWWCRQKGIKREAGNAGSTTPAEGRSTGSGSSGAERDAGGHEVPHPDQG